MAVVDHRAAYDRPAAARWPLLAAIPVLILLAFTAQTAIWALNADTSWLITIIDRMRAGDRLFVDIVEVNPPGSVWLYMLPVQASYLTGISPEALVRLYTILIVAAGVAMTGWIVRAGRLMASGRAVLPAMAVLFLAASILVGNAFAERDHIGAVLLTPLIALSAWRATAASAGPGPRHWIAAGAAGSIVAVVKPYYAVIVLAAATYAVVRRRDPRLFFLPEFLIAGGMTMAYALASYLAYPVYFEQLLPLLRETYLAFSWPLSRLALAASPWLAIIVAYHAFARRGARSVLSDLLLICGCTAWLSYFFQGKGWAYHAYPAIYLGSAAIVVAVCNLLFQKDSAPAARPMKPLEVAGLALLAILAAHMRFLRLDDNPSTELVAEVREQAPRPTVGLLGGNIAAGHPLARAIGGRWAEPYCSDWIAVYALRLEEEAERAGDGARAAHMRTLVQDYLAQKRRRLMQAPPEVLIVERNDDLTAMMLADYGFDRLLERYVRIGSDGPLEVYRLAAPGLTAARPLTTAASPAAASG